MPKLTRSPNSGNFQQTLSDSDVSKINPTVSTPVFLSQRHKRQREPSEEDFSSFKKEIKAMLDDWKDSQTSLMNKLISEIADIKTQNSEIKLTNEDIQRSMTFLNDQYENFKVKVESLEKERKQHLTQIASLESKIEDMERNSKSSTIEIRNVLIPKERETKDDLCNIVQKTCQALKVNVQQSTIRDVYRIKNKSGKGTIIAEFTSVLLKNEVIQGVKLHNKEHSQQRLTSADIGLPGLITPVYVSEALTNKGRRLFFLARDIAKTQEYKFCWTRNGIIYLRKSVNAPHIEIKEESQLMSLRNQS